MPNHNHNTNYHHHSLLRFYALGILVFGLGIVGLSFQQFNLSKQQINDELITMKSLLNQGQTINRVENDYTKLAAQADILTRAYPPDLDTVSATLKKLATAQHLTITVREIGSSYITSNSIFTLEIQTKGDFKNLLSFLAQIENLSYYLNINTIRLQLNSNPGDQTQITALFLASVRK